MARYATPLDAEAAFYAAFSRKDLEAMMAVWDEAPDVVCVHPMGDALLGREAIRASWEAIFRHGPDMTFMVEERSRTQQGAFAVHVVHEHIREGRATSRPPIIATNVYRLTPGGWRMVLHHGSPPARSGEPAPRQTMH
jgi:uncharacterized protein (TIGR02246 family)